MIETIKKHLGDQASLLDYQCTGIDRSLSTGDGFTAKDIQHRPHGRHWLCLNPAGGPGY